jgi:alpha-tubulin suppressor-like RCC1 family protein
MLQGGVLYSWGAGECGQLGTGQCTRREVPAPIMLTEAPSRSEPRQAVVPTGPLIAVDIACGSAHAVAADEDGRLYCWGLSKSNQLGLDNFRTQGYPALADVVLDRVADPALPEGASALEDVSFAQVFANGHSSAAIDTQGRLFTWGSTQHHRLMHQLPLQPLVPVEDKALTYSELRTKRVACARGNVGHMKASRAQALAEAAAAKALQRLPVTNVPRPTLVMTDDLQGCVVKSFAFAASHSAALVLTCLKKVRVCISFYVA